MTQVEQVVPGPGFSRILVPKDRYKKPITHAAIFSDKRAFLTLLAFVISSRLWREKAMDRVSRNGAGEERIGKVSCFLQPIRKNGEVTLQEHKRRMAEVVTLTDDDLREPETRPGEPLFHQFIRNIVHKGASGNLFAEGLLEHIGRGAYWIIDAGRAHRRSAA